jgi:hypothetical protein
MAPMLLVFAGYPIIPGPSSSSPVEEHSRHDFNDVSFAEFRLLFRKSRERSVVCMETLRFDSSLAKQRVQSER